MKIDDIPAGRKLDALVAERVFGASRRDVWYYYDSPKNEVSASVPHYSTDIKAAWEVVNWIEANRWTFILTGPEYLNEEGKLVGGYKAIFIDSRSERPAVRATADTLPLAICRAALKAVGVIEVPDSLGKISRGIK